MVVFDCTPPQTISKTYGIHSSESFDWCGFLKLDTGYEYKKTERLVNDRPFVFHQINKIRDRHLVMRKTCVERFPPTRGLSKLRNWAVVNGEISAENSAPSVVGLTCTRNDALACGSPSPLLIVFG